MNAVLRIVALFRSLGAAGAFANVAEDTAAREAQARAIDALVVQVESRLEPLSQPAA